MIKDLPSVAARYAKHTKKTQDEQLAKTGTIAKKSSDDMDFEWDFDDQPETTPKPGRIHLTEEAEVEL